MERRLCARCVCDTTIPSLRFAESGVCNLCGAHDRMAARYLPRSKRDGELQGMIARIKRAGRRRAYDCIVGVSGGTDSSYALHVAKTLGLRPLAVHFDNGWNTEKSVSNIQRLTNKLDVDLHTHVVDWEQFKGLQVAFLKAGVPCVETPTDVAIHAVLYRAAADEKVQWILGGQSFMTEGTMPREWSYLDGTYIQSVQRTYGSASIALYPNLTLPAIFYYTFMRGIRQMPLLNYIDYDKTEAKRLLAAEYGWQDYGGHHYENAYSRFAFGWYLPRKFGIDKRKVSLSGPVRSRQMTRGAALEALAAPPDVDDHLVDYCIHKLGISRRGLDAVMAGPNKTYRDYFTSESILKFFDLPMRAAVKLNVFTPVLYEKYFK
jgi:N-acetyl sugar amidotransferase